MKRKVVKHGPSSLTISLPIKWVNNAGLKPGDEIEIEYEDNVLRVYAGDIKGKEKHITIDLSEQSDFSLKRFMAIFYKLGYDEVKLILKEPKLIPTLQNIINEMFIGYEIIEQTNRKCIIKNISGDRTGEFENILRRLFLVTVSLAKNSLEIIKSGDVKDIQEILVLEMTNNKLSNYLHRLIIKSTFGNIKPFIYLIIWELEGVGDDYRDACKYLQSLEKIELSDTLLKLYEETNNNLDEFHRKFYKHKLSDLIELENKLKDTAATLKEEIVKAKQKESPVYHYLISINVRLFEIINAVIAYQTGDNEEYIK